MSFGRTHTLKTWSVYWDAVERGEKTFEVRRDDRGFQNGDILVLRRMVQSSAGGWNEDRSDNQPKDIRRKVTFILMGGQFGVEPGFVVMGMTKA